MQGAVRSSSPPPLTLAGAFRPDATGGAESHGGEMPKTHDTFWTRLAKINNDNIKSLVRR